MSSQWPLVPLGEVLNRVERFEKTSPLEEYNFAGTLSFGRGIFKGNSKLGSEFHLDKIQRIKTNDFVYCKIMAWEGAFGIVPPETDNCVMSGAFVVYEPVEEKIEPKFLNYYFKIESVWREVGSQSTGTNVRRRSLHPKIFEKTKIPLPPISEQRRIIKIIDHIAQKIQQARTIRQQAEEQVEALFSAKLRATVLECGNKVRYLPFTDLARIERRPVTIHLDQNYQEIGVYCFGKGIFHKSPRTGAEVGAKDLYQIRAGDFILQITFAWEGAVALAEPCDDGLFASVRYLTFRVNEEVCNPRYLLTYMKTPKAIAQLGRISPGSAGRNRVLSVKRLNEVIVPVVPRSAQTWLTDDLQAKINKLKDLQNQTAAELDALLPSVLDKAFKGQL